MPKIRRLVEESLKISVSDSRAVAEGLATALHARGAIPRAPSWAKVVLAAMVASALDRSLGNRTVAARSICEDLACHTPFHLARKGWFADDPWVQTRWRLHRASLGDCEENEKEEEGTARAA